MSEWWVGLSQRERRFVMAGAAALLLFGILIALRTGGGRGPDERVELAQAPPAPAAPNPAGSPPPPPPATFTASPPPAQPAASGGYVLYGVIGGGPGGGAAIIGPSGGSQRAVRVGRPAGGGMTLKEVGPGYAVLTGPSGDLRLELVTPPPLPAR